jgi:mannose-6-phosphate isomerase
MKIKLYPFVFEPIFKERIWGGAKLKSELNKQIPSDTIGESWEISSVQDHVSIVKNGFLKGKSLNEILQEYPLEILGISIFENFGDQFPLLFKFLDAKEDLSIQLHPNDELAKKRHNSFGKTEMWYVIQADEGAKLIVGFKENSSQEEYLYHVNNKSIVSILDQIPVQKGDVFFLETGTIHAIGAGTVIAEIQQTSDITYRIYDFDRKDAQGNTRELHNDLALEAINYKKVFTQKEYDRHFNTSNIAVSCPYFTTSVITLNGKFFKEHNGNSFVVYMCTEGSFTINYDSDEYAFSKGDTVLVPAEITKYELIGVATLLEISII